MTVGVTESQISELKGRASAEANSVVSNTCLSGCSMHVVLSLGGTVNECRLLALSA